jgi:hypothetical protein
MKVTRIFIRKILFYSLRSLFLFIHPLVIAFVIALLMVSNFCIPNIQLYMLITLHHTLFFYSLKPIKLNIIREHISMILDTHMDSLLFILARNLSIFDSRPTH